MLDHGHPARLRSPGHADGPGLAVYRPGASRWRMLLALALGFVVGLSSMLLLRDRQTAASLDHAMPPAAPALAVSVVTPQWRDLAQPVVGDGSVGAWQDLVIGAETGGLRVVEVTFEEGDHVRRGDLLVRLDDTVVVAQRDQAEAGAREAAAALHIAQQELGRATALVRSQSTSRQILEQRQAAMAQAEARLAIALAAREEAAARLLHTRILAPTDGVVSRRSVLLGAVTAAGQEMLRLIRDSEVELQARVPELDLARVRVGQRAQVTHGERVVDAVVRIVAPVVAQDTRLGLVHITLPPDSGLRPGMFAHAQILPEATPALTLPQEAVVLRDGRSVVFVLAGTDDRVAVREVATGRRRDGMAEVTAGMAPEDQVVLHGAGFLNDGDRVNTVPAGR